KRKTMSLIGRLRAADVELTARNSDPWFVRLERLRGKVGADGVERIATQTLFDHLEVRQRNRGAGACRRLAQVMRALGWTPVRVRDLTRGGYKEQVRGYCRMPGACQPDQSRQPRDYLSACRHEGERVKRRAARNT